MRLRRGVAACALLTAAAMVLSGCSSPGPMVADSAKQQSFGSGAALRVASGSENREVADAVARAADKAHVRVTLDYMGSLDVMDVLEHGGERNGVEYDAVWPASSMWISMGDTRHVVKDALSTSTTPIVFGVAKKKAVRLGWADKSGRTRPVSTKDILSKVESGDLRFSMTSATQSNSGASAYLAFLTALQDADKPVSEATLKDPTVRARVKTILSGVDRSSGSSDWLKDMVVANPDRFDAMVNYESLVIQTDKQLVKAGKDPLLAVYPSDGLAVSDSPLGYVDRNQGVETRSAYRRFADAIHSNESQLLFEQAGRRTGLGGMLTNPSDKTVKSSFRAEWGVDASSGRLKSIVMPDADTVKTALSLYQTELRKPSWTVWVVDYSGSMAGEGKTGVVNGLTTALNPVKAGRYGIQPGLDDVNILIPFDDTPRTPVTAHGTDTGALLEDAAAEDADGGTDIYAGLQTALDHLPPAGEASKYTTAVALLTDGQSTTWGKSRAAAAYKTRGRGLPVFPIMFGDADPSQLDDLASLSNGKVFDGRTGDPGDVFRTVKGYN